MNYQIVIIILNTIWVGKMSNNVQQTKQSVQKESGDNLGQGLSCSGEPVEVKTVDSYSKQMNLEEARMEVYRKESARELFEFTQSYLEKNHPEIWNTIFHLILKDMTNDVKDIKNAVNRKEEKDK